MKWVNIYYILFFLLGYLVSYISLQYTYFDIKTEIDVPNLIISIFSLFLGFYIADTIQKKLFFSQIQHTLILNKIDFIWNNFNNISQTLIYNSQLEIDLIKKLTKEVIHPLVFLKNIFHSYKLNQEDISKLEKLLEDLEDTLSNMKAFDNIVTLNPDESKVVKDKIEFINTSFSEVLTSVQRV